MKEKWRRIARPLVGGSLAAAFTLLAGCGPSDLEKGRISLALGDSQRSAEAFSRVLDKRPDDARARLGLGQALLQQAVDHPPDHASWKAALVHLEAGATLRPDTASEALVASAYLDWARAQLGAADTLAAIYSLAMARERSPRNTGALNLAGILQCRLGRPEKGKELFELALEADAENVSAHFNLGMLAWQIGDFDAAKSHWQAARHSAPENADLVHWFDEAAEGMPLP